MTLKPESDNGFRIPTPLSESIVLEIMAKQAFGWDLNKLSIAKNSLSRNESNEEIHVMKKRSLHFPELPKKNSLILAEKNWFSVSATRLRSLRFPLLLACFRFRNAEANFDAGLSGKSRFWRVGFKKNGEFSSLTTYKIEDESFEEEEEDDENLGRGIWREKLAGSGGKLERKFGT